MSQELAQVKLRINSLSAHNSTLKNQHRSTGNSVRAIPVLHFCMWEKGLVRFGMAEQPGEHSLLAIALLNWEVRVRGFLY